jgi:hypothetical protein
MFGMNGIILPSSYFDGFNHLFFLGDYLKSIGWGFEDSVPNYRGIGHYLFLFILLLIVWYFPNTYEIFGKYSPMMDSTMVSKEGKDKPLIKWVPHPVMAIVLAMVMMIVLFKMDSTSEFLYYQF